MSITRISQEIVRPATAVARREIEFSPLDLLIFGHFPLGAVYGFSQWIDMARLRRALAVAQVQNVEMGAVLRIGTDGVHRLMTGYGIELIVQDCDEPMPCAEFLGSLPLQNYPLARTAALTVQDLVRGDVPLLGFTVTRFQDGCTLGVRTTHSHVDGAALTRFVVAVGETYGCGDPVNPVCGRDQLTELVADGSAEPSLAFPVIRGKGPPAAGLVHNGSEPGPCSCTYVRIDEDAFRTCIEAVRRGRNDISSSDVVCALGWKAWARSAPGNSSGHSRLYSLFDIRRVLGLSDDYQGNAVIDRMAELDFGEVRTLPLVELAARYRSAVKPLQREEVLQDLAYVSSLHRARRYREDGCYTDFVRRFVPDMASGAGLLLNDIRRLPTDQVCFDRPADWYDSGQDYQGRGYLEVSQRRDRSVIFRYHATLSEAACFEKNLRMLVTELS